MRTRPMSLIAASSRSSRRALANAVLETLELRRMLAGDAPVAVADTASVNEDQVLTLTHANLMANDTDPDTASDQLSIIAVGNATNGTVTLNPDSTITFTPDPEFFGEARFDYTLSDGDQTSTALVTITVNGVNDTPTLDPIADPAAINEDAGQQTVSLSGISAGAPTEAGQVLTITATSNNTALVANPTVAYTAGNPTGSLTYTPVANANGTAIITVTVNDNNGGSITRTFTITVNAVADAPTAVADTVNVDEDQALTLAQSTLLANDSDPDGNNQLSIIAVGNASNGTATLNPDGSITFTPDPNFHGEARFEYTLSDGAQTSTALVTITVRSVNDAPTIDPIANPPAIDEDAGEQTVQVTGIGDVDANQAQTLVVTASSSQPNRVPHPTVNYDRESGTATLKYTPVGNASGPVTITVVVSDGSGGTTTRTFTVTINPVPDAPIAIADAYTLNEDTPLITTANTGVLQYDTDPDGDTFTAILLAGPEHGTLTLNADGSFTYTPSRNYYGSDSFTYKVRDEEGIESDIVTVTLTINAVNDAPTTRNINVTRTPGATVNLDVLSGSSDIDVDGQGNHDKLYISIVRKPAYGTASINNNGTALDPTDDFIVYTPGRRSLNKDTLRFAVSDGKGGIKFGEATIYIAGAGLIPSLDRKQTELVILGTDGHDEIRIDPGADGKVKAVLNGVVLGLFNPTGRIIVEGAKGCDLIVANAKLRRSVDLRGGVGHDTLIGCSANDTLLGEAGNDMLMTGYGKDVLNGGAGKNSIIYGRKKLS